MSTTPFYDICTAQNLAEKDQFWIDEEDRIEMANLGYARSDLRNLFLKLDESHFLKVQDYGGVFKMDVYLIGTISPSGDSLHKIYIKFRIKDDGRFLMIPSYHESRY